MKATMAERVLPADVYDTLELSALAYGGIGAGLLIRLDEPCCAIGQMIEAGVPINLPEQYGDFPVYGFTARESDDAVEAINSLHGNTIDWRVGTWRRVGTWDRVPFAAWCHRLNVVRGT